jgi:hypothetical protein
MTQSHNSVVVELGERNELENISCCRDSPPPPPSAVLLWSLLNFHLLCESFLLSSHSTCKQKAIAMRRSKNNLQKTTQKCQDDQQTKAHKEKSAKHNSRRTEMQPHSAASQEHHHLQFLLDMVQHLQIFPLKKNGQCKTQCTRFSIVYGRHEAIHKSFHKANCSYCR